MCICSNVFHTNTHTHTCSESICFLGDDWADDSHMWTVMEATSDVSREKP